MKYAISACLLGENCKYNGKNNRCEELIHFLQGKEFISVCPEVLGGLPTPRESCEIVRSRVFNTNHEEKTEAFLLGAKLALQQIKENQIEFVIVQSRSPSCGCGKIYDGSFLGKLIDGNGIFVEIVLKEGIKVVDVEEFIASIHTKSE